MKTETRYDSHTNMPRRPIAGFDAADIQRDVAMDSFDKWFAKQGEPTEKEKSSAEIDLPIGVWGDKGEYFATCRSCGKSYELPIDPIEDGFDQDMSYCNGSQYCTP